MGRKSPFCCAELSFCIASSLLRASSQRSETIQKIAREAGRFACVVIRLGFEPKTHSLEGCCSIQLSYRTVPHFLQDVPAVQKWTTNIRIIPLLQRIQLRFVFGRLLTCAIMKDSFHLAHPPTLQSLRGHPSVPGRIKPCPPGTPTID